MICKNCGREHDGLYGSGLFCNRSCQVSFTNKQRGKHSEETKNKISKSLRLNKKKYCKFCGKEINGKSLYCSKECKLKMQYHLPTLIKYFTYNKDVIGTINAIAEYNRIKDMLYDLYWNKKLTSSEIAKKFNYNTHIENIVNKVFKMLKIPGRNCSESTQLNILLGKQKFISFNNHYKQQWHITWNNKHVFLRSSYELDYAKYLDEYNIDYEVETLRIKYFDTQKQKYRCAIPDFYLLNTNTIVEIKSNYTLSIQNMKDKFNAYRKLGYNVKLILEHKEVDIDTL